MRVLTCIFLFILTITIDASAQPGFYDRHWSEVYRFEVKNLPKSALSEVDLIYDYAKREKNDTQIIKSLLYRCKFLAMLEEDAELKVISGFKKEMSVSSSPAKNLLHSMVAEIYRDYYKHYRYKYYNRSRTDKKVNELDFRTWDANQLLNEIHGHYQASLKNDNQLKQVKLSGFDTILTENHSNLLNKSTLYDFLAGKALEFYRTEGGLTTFDKPLVIGDSTLVFGFEKITFPPVDTLDMRLHSFRIFQELLKFHSSSQDTAAYVIRELDRLKFLNERNRINSLLIHNALLQLQAKFRKHPVSTLVDLELAVRYNRGDIKFASQDEPRFAKRVAVELCDRAVALFPESDGATKARALKAMIIAPDLQVRSQGYVQPGRHGLVYVSYKNVDTLLLSVISIDEETAKRLDNYRSDSLRNSLLQAEPLVSWSVKLKTADDYDQHSTEVVLPALEKGVYLVYARQSMGTAGGIDNSGIVRVTDLAMVTQDFDDVLLVQLVSRNNGEPQRRLPMRIVNHTYNGQAPVDSVYFTDSNGFVRLNKSSLGKSGMLILYAGTEADAVSFGSYHYYHSASQKTEKDTYDVHCVLFSDRSIYRPGHTVFVKGILMKVIKQKSHVVENEYVSVTMYDANNQKLEVKKFRTNAFGSFSGEFVIPMGRLTGVFTLTAEEGDEESALFDDMDDFYSKDLEFSVEEYKRPSFELTFMPVTSTVRLNDTIRVEASADAYNGSKVSGAMYTYTVKRRVIYPRWGSWRGNIFHPESQVAQGQGTTTRDGKLMITFEATPDQNVPSGSLPVFHYEVAVTVTDLNGETRKASSVVKAGFHTMNATMDLPTELDRNASPPPIFIKTENLNGQRVPAKGTITVFRIVEASSPQRPRPWSVPDSPVLDADQYRALFPSFAVPGVNFEDSVNRNEPVAVIQFNTSVATVVKLPLSRQWKTGRYLIELETTDNFGTTVKDIVRFLVTDSREMVMPANRPLHLKLDRTSYKPGDVAVIQVASYANVETTLSVIVDGRMSSITIEKTGPVIKHIRFPVPQNMTAEFMVRATTCVDNAFVSAQQRASLREEKSNLSIEILSFRDKVAPGETETWSFIVKGNTMGKDAEVLASMYDLSLDQFSPHKWEVSRSWEHRSYFNSALAARGFETTSYYVSNRRRAYYHHEYNFYHDYDWFGFSITNPGYRQRYYTERLYYQQSAADRPSKVIMKKHRDLDKGLVTGTVTTAAGESLPGVNVLIKGTTKGTATDQHGRYLLEVNPGETLVFSHVGYAGAEAKRTGRNVIDVVMEEAVLNLAEIVVTSYGVQIQKNLTGSVSVVAADSVLEENEIFYSLEGRTAGIEVKREKGEKGFFVIRGKSSISGESKPLYIVDGVVVTELTLNESDIVDVQSLKGAAATALYGSQGANGVIVITTRAGQRKLDREMATIKARKDLRETAFFIPHITTDKQGRITFSFTTPEALTRWKLQLLAHNKEFQTATKTITTVTQKELMVVPNAPRFLRVDDEMIFSVKVVNLGNDKKVGSIGLWLSDVVNDADLNLMFGNQVFNKSFSVAAKGTVEVSWKLKVPVTNTAVQFKVLAKSGKISDGEQFVLPVLSHQIMVTETLPVHVRGRGRNDFVMPNLRDLNSPTLRNHRLTFELTTNPVWHVVQALPYLMEFPFECAEQLFARYYANAVALHLTEEYPVIKQVLRTWMDTGNAESPLHKNQEFKSILLQETPWVLEAAGQSEMKKRLASLLDSVKVREQQKVIAARLSEMQLSNGGFPWFSGNSRPDHYITQHIVTTYAHLIRLGAVPDDKEMLQVMVKAEEYLDRTFLQMYKEVMTNAENFASDRKGDSRNEGMRLFLARKHISTIHLQYLYMRSALGRGDESEALAEAIRYYMDQSKTWWQDFSLLQKAMTVLIHLRSGDHAFATAVIGSLKEHAIIDHEKGMYWKENVAGVSWFDSPVETHAMLMEAIAASDAHNSALTGEQRTKVLDDLRLWLLRNKQTTNWKSTKATTEAVYALLTSGNEWVTPANDVRVMIGNEVIESSVVDAEHGTGYFTRSWDGQAIQKVMGNVTITKQEDGGVSWGALYWQYFENLDRIPPANTPLTLKKHLFVVNTTAAGAVLTPVVPGTSVNVGELLRVRIELSVDRPMEFLHMKDLRAAGLEPVDVFSLHKWQDGLGYYQSTRDAATHFFFDRIDRGVYVFEYDLRANAKGDFSNGMATIQCMYAPEYTSRSEGIRLRIEK
jgi:TonB-dependent SusC/RagA subfamily outer membrane receptor